MTLTQRFLAVAVAGLVLVCALAYTFWPGRTDKTVTAHFPATVGLYVGDDVRALGVSIGKIRSVTPQRDSVRVVMSYRGDVVLPADAKAAVLAPTLVTGRYVQLSPLWRDGAQLADGADIPLQRTAVPVEWGQITEQLKKVTDDLGPDGVNRDGALNRILDTTAANLGGQGTNFNETVQALSRAATTLSDGRGDLFGTVRNLQVFAGLLARNDKQVQDFNRQLASVSGVLAENRQNMSTALRTLDESLPIVEKFVGDNRGKLTADVDKLGDVTRILADNRQSLADLLQIIPAAASNFNNIYEPTAGSLTGALALTNVHDPATFICAAIFSAGGTPAQCQQALRPLVGWAKMDNLPVQSAPVDLTGQAPAASPRSEQGRSADSSPKPREQAGLGELLAPGGNR